MYNNGWADEGRQVSNSSRLTVDQDGHHWRPCRGAHCSQGLGHYAPSEGPYVAGSCCVWNISGGWWPESNGVNGQTRAAVRSGQRSKLPGVKGAFCRLPWPCSHGHLHATNLCTLHNPPAPAQNEFTRCSHQLTHFCLPTHSTQPWDIFTLLQLQSTTIPTTLCAEREIDPVIGSDQLSTFER